MPEASELKFEWTGEFRPPKLGEWYISKMAEQPIQAGEIDEGLAKPRWILRAIPAEQVRERAGGEVVLSAGAWMECISGLRNEDRESILTVGKQYQLWAPRLYPEYAYSMVEVTSDTGQPAVVFASRFRPTEASGRTPPCPVEFERLIVVCRDGYASQRFDAADQLRSAFAAMAKERDEARKALEPFAKASERYILTDEKEMFPGVVYGDLRRAAALSQPQAKEEE